jgi:hypothetical protein
MEEKIEYKVRRDMDNNYKVVSEEMIDDFSMDEVTHFTGSLSDCEAWIRLHEGGYM